MWKGVLAGMCAEAGVTSARTPLPLKLGSAIEQRALRSPNLNEPVKAGIAFLALMKSQRHRPIWLSRDLFLYRLYVFQEVVIYLFPQARLRKM